MIDFTGSSVLKDTAGDAVFGTFSKVPDDGTGEEALIGITTGSPVSEPTELVAVSLSYVAWLSEAVIGFDGSTGMSLDVAGPVVTTGIPAVNGLVSSVRLAGRDSGGGTDGRLEVGEITIGGVSSVALAVPVFADMEIGKASDGCFPPTVSEALAETVCLAGEGSVGGEDSVAEGPGVDRPPGRPDGEAGFSEARSVCAPREVSFAGNTSVTEGKGAEYGESVTRGTGGRGALSVDEPVSMAREDSVNGGTSVTSVSPLIWGAFSVAVAVPVCTVREASVDGDTSVEPGTKV